MSKLQKGTIADKVIECLEAEGVQFIAGVPGEENSEFLMALDRAQKRGSKIQFLLTRHEQGASFIVDSIARLTLKPQVALTTLGPGATNIVTGVANAYLDKIPLVFISGQADSIRLHRSSFQNIDTIQMFEPITLYNTAILHAESVNEVVRKCFKVATARQGPTHFELSRDIAKTEINEKKWSEYKPLHPATVYMPAPNEKLLKETLAFIRAAKKPILLVGYNTIRTEAVQAVRRFVEKAKIMALNTPIAKGVIDARSNYSLFTVGFVVSEKRQLQALQESDCIITVGFDQTEFPPELWNTSMNTNIVHIDSLRRTEVNRLYNPKFEIVGDISATLNYYVQEKLEFTQSPFNFRQELVEILTQLKDEETTGFLHPERILCDLRKAMKEDDILVSDVGQHMLYITKIFQCYQPNTCLISNGLATMGFGLPAAIGAKIVHPEKNVVAICGDGGFLMNSQEMETAKRLCANVVVIIFKDDEYGMITFEQQREYNRNVFTSFTNPDFVLMAKSFGWQGREVKSSKEFPAALQEAFAMSKSSPVLLQVPVDYKSRNNMLSSS